jgi:hypothetical protein
MQEKQLHQKSKVGHQDYPHLLDHWPQRSHTRTQRTEQGHTHYLSSHLALVPRHPQMDNLCEAAPSQDQDITLQQRHHMGHHRRYHR